MCMISWMIRPPCELTGQLAVGTQNYFSTLFYTPYTNIKTSAQNAPKCTIARKKNQKFSGEGIQPLPRPLPYWGGGYPSPDPTPRRLRRSAFPFLFTYDSNTAYIAILFKYWKHLTTLQYLCMSVVLLLRQSAADCRRLPLTVYR